MENENPVPDSSPDAKKKMSIRDFLSMGEVGRYFFRKKNKGEPLNVNTRIMHGINKFAIIVFLLGIIYFIIKRFI